MPINNMEPKNRIQINTYKIGIMKTTCLVISLLWFAGVAQAQQDTLITVQQDTTIHKEPDTIRVGNFVIVRQKKDGDEKTKKTKALQSLSALAGMTMIRYNKLTNRQ